MAIEPSFALWAVFADMKSASVMLSADQQQITLLQTGVNRRSFVLHRAPTNEAFADRQALATLAQQKYSGQFVFCLVDLFIQERVIPEQALGWLATNLQWIVPVLSDLDYPLVSNVSDALRELGAGPGRTRIACWILNELCAIIGMRPLELAQLASRREKHRDLRTGEVYLAASAAKGDLSVGILEKRVRVIRPKIAYVDPLTGVARVLGRGRMHGSFRLWAVHAECLLTQQFLKAAATRSKKGVDSDMRATANLLMRWIIRMFAYRHTHQGEALDVAVLRKALSIEALSALLQLPLTVVPTDERWGVNEILESLGFVQRPVNNRKQLDAAAMTTLEQMIAHLQQVLDWMPEC